MFSIIIPLFNKQDSIQDTISSVLNQTFSDFEILIIDDGSTDKSVERVNEISDSRIRVIQGQGTNAGVSSARNQGIKEARFRYLAFLDADDLWKPTYLEEQAKLINDFPDAKMWGCAWNYLLQSGEVGVNHSLPKDFRNYLNDYFEMKKTSNLFWTSAVVIDKSVFDKIEMFDENLLVGEDLDVWYRIILNFKVTFFNKILSFYKQDSENRAMLSLPVLEKCLFFNVRKYKKERQNEKFRYFIDQYALRQLFPYYLKTENRKKVELVLNEIDFSLQSFRWILQYQFPRLFYALFRLKKNVN